MRRPEHAREVGLAVVLAVALGVAGSLVLRLASAGVPFWYTVALAAVLIALLRMGRWACRGTEYPSVPEYGPGRERARTVALLAPIERRLANATRDRRLYAGRLRPTLYTLARERVRRHGGPDLGELDGLPDDPARSALARDVLGEELWRWLIDPTPEGPAPDPRQVERLVSAIEAL